MLSPAIGVFDSGFGGLTVLRALMQQIPAASYLYLGDTARLPYGAKSRHTIARYAVEAARFLAAHGASHLVIACNTASALAMPEIVAAVPIPVTGVIAPVVQMTHLRHPAADTLILATTATVQSHAYRQHCEACGLQPTEKACPLLVPLIEEGWIDHPVTTQVLQIYLREALEICNPRVVILGCTHYPLIAPLVEQTLRQLGCEADVVDSAEATAAVVARAFRELTHAPSVSPVAFECYATDSVEKFQRLGSAFLGQPLPRVHLLDLGG